MAQEKSGDAGAQAQQGAAYQPSAAGAKVTVYCNLPNGLRIHADRMIEQRELILGGGSRMVKIAERVGPDVLIHGNASPRMPDGKVIERHRMIAGYAVTDGVPKDIWDAWIEANRDSAAVRNKCIFAHQKVENGDAEARDNRERRTGLEPFEQDGDPRRPRGRNNVGDITRATETAEA